MLNEQRVKLMTKMASYEVGEGKKSMAIGTYFRGDYIGKEVIKSFCYGTVAFLIVFALYIAYDFEIFMADIYKMDMIEFGKNVGATYFKFIVVYMLITYVIYAIRYRHARRSLRIYYNNLRRLNAMYCKEEKEKRYAMKHGVHKNRRR